MSLPPSGMIYSEFYLFSDKQWDIIPSGVSAYNLSHEVLQNAPVIVTSSGYETTLSTDPWGQVEGSGKWEKRGHGFFTVTPAGSYDTTKKEFTFNPSSSGRIEFNQTLDEVVYVEYESYPSGYYYVDTININPIARETDSGFLQISRVGDPYHLSLRATQSILKADSFHRTNLLATLYDSDLKRIEDKKIIFKMLFYVDPYAGPFEDIGYLIPGKDNGGVYRIYPSGFVSEVYSYTDRFGQASAQFSTYANKDGWAVIKAYYSEDSDIYDTTEIVCYRWRRGPFVLDYSMLDSLDYLDDVTWSTTGIYGDKPED